MRGWHIPLLINTDKAPTYGCALARLKHESLYRPDVEHRQNKYLNIVSEYEHAKLKRIFAAMLGLKYMKMAWGFDAQWNENSR